MTKTKTKPKQKKPSVARDARGYFLPGTGSANPGGRPKGFKGLAAYIRKETGEGIELADFAIRVMRNEGKRYKHSDQWQALQFLADRAFGKPVTTVIELDGSDAPDFAAIAGLSTEALNELEDVLAKVGIR